MDAEVKSVRLSSSEVTICRVVWEVSLVFSYRLILHPSLFLSCKMIIEELVKLHSLPLRS